MLEFTKMTGAGNDYVFVDTFTKELTDPASLAIRISERHFGVGSDGLIVIGPSRLADFRMDIYNADGSQAEMCGNGLRCAGKYVCDKGFTSKRTLRFETLAGIRALTMEEVRGAEAVATADMGRPRLAPKEIPVNAEGSDYVTVSLPSQDTIFSATCVSMGNPHAVIFTDDVDALNLSAVGPDLENAPVFPCRTNVEFIRVESRGLLKMRVWERGSAETMACGTGACAAAVASVLHGYTDRDVTVRLKGGRLRIRWDADNGHVYMTGPAVTVFEGRLLS